MAASPPRMAAVAAACLGPMWCSASRRAFTSLYTSRNAWMAGRDEKDGATGTARW